MKHIKSSNYKNKQKNKFKTLVWQLMKGLAEINSDQGWKQRKQRKLAVSVHVSGVYRQIDRQIDR